MAPSYSLAHNDLGSLLFENGRIPDREPFSPWWDGTQPFTQFYTLTQLAMYAAYAAGALAFDDALRIACAYSRMLRRFRGQGAMALVELGWEAAGAVAAVQQGSVFRAVEDSRETTVLGGPPLAMAAAVEALGASGIACRWVWVDVAPHCPLLQPARTELLQELRSLRPRRAKIPFISGVTGSELSGERLDAEHWARNFTEPVSFSRAIDTLIGQGHRVFVDVGPHPITRTAPPIV